MSEPAQFLQQVLSPQVSQAYRNGLDQAEGFVVDAVEASFASTAADVVDAFGYGSARASLLNRDGSVDVLRVPVTPFHRLIPAVEPRLAGPGERGILDPPPYTGTGFTACERQSVAQWRLGRSRLPAGSELWRVAANGGEQLLDAYRGTARGWGAGPSGAFPSHLLGPKAEWAGTEWLADLDTGGDAVVLTAIARQSPPGFQQVRDVVHERVVAAAEISALVDTTLSCRVDGEPFEVVNTSQGRANLTYVGGDFRVAQRMGLSYAQPSVYEATVPLDQLVDVQGEQRGVPLTTA